MARWFPKIFIFASLVCAGFFYEPARADLDDRRLNEYIRLCNDSKSAFNGFRMNASTPPVLSFELYKTTFSDLCDFLVQIKTVRAKIGDLSEKLSLLNQTKESWVKRMALTTTIMRYAASKRNQNPSPTNIAEIENEREREELREFYDMTADNENMEMINVSRFKSGRERAQNMDDFQRAVRRRAMIEENLSCPDGFKGDLNEKDENLREIYLKEIQPLAQKHEELRRKREYYYKRLQEIGPTFLRDDAANLYYNELNNLHKTGILIKVTEKAIPYQAYIKKETGDPDAPVSLVKVDRSYKIQEFTSLPSTQAFEKFKNNWSARWKDYVDQGAKGIETNATTLEACIGTPGKPEVTDITNTQSAYDLANYQRRCSFALEQKTEPRPALVFNEVIDRYKKFSIELATTKAKLSTLQSKYLRKPVDYSESLRNGGAGLEDRPVCNEQTMSLAEIKAEKNKMLDAENEFKEIIARERLKTRMIDDEEREKQKRLAEEIRVKSKVIENKNKKDTEDSAKVKAINF